MKALLSHSRRGGIVVETIIILVVIVLLVLIAIPVYRGGPEDARVAQAQRDVLTLARAQERLADTVGYYLPLQLLDNEALSDEARTARADTLANEPDALKAIPRDLEASDGPPEQPALDDLSNLRENWAGPYAQIKRIYLGEARENLDLSVISEQSVRRDYPLDPWGQPYRFYSPIGIIGSRAAKTSTDTFDTDAFSDGALTTDDDRFETFAIVSYGPNGESDSVTDINDDIIYLFEAPGDEIAEIVETGA